jgi:hypothetical protein
LQGNSFRKKKERACGPKEKLKPKRVQPKKTFERKEKTRKERSSIKDSEQEGEPDCEKKE